MLRRSTTDKVEGNQHELGVGRFEKKVACAPAAANCALSCGAGDRVESEKSHLAMALMILRTAAAGDTEEAVWEVRGRKPATRVARGRG